MALMNIADALYLGGTAVDKVMLGAVQVWPPVAPPTGVSVDYVSAGAQGKTCASGGSAASVSPLVFSHAVGAGCSELLIFVCTSGSFVTIDVTVDGVSAALLDEYSPAESGTAVMAVFRVAAPSAGTKEVKVYARSANASNYGRETLCTAASVSIKGSGTLATTVSSGGSASAPAQTSVALPAIQCFAHLASSGGWSGYSQNVLWQAASSAGNGYALIIGSNLSASGTADFECSGPVGGNWTGIAVKLDA